MNFSFPGEMRTLDGSLEGLTPTFGHGQSLRPAKMSIISKIAMIFSGQNLDLADILRK
jgi:hypothetical protein